MWQVLVSFTLSALKGLVKQESRAIFNHEFEKKVFGWYSVLRHQQSTIKLEPFEYEWEGGIISSETPLGQNNRPTLKPKNYWGKRANEIKARMQRRLLRIKQAKSHFQIPEIFRIPVLRERWRSYGHEKYSD